MKRSFGSLIVLSLVILLFSACKRNPLKVDISNIETEAEFVRFSDQLFNFEGKDTLVAMADLSNEYPDFFNLFTYRIINIGGIGEDNFPDLIKLFLTDTTIQEVRLKTETVFGNQKKLEKQIKKAFKYFAFHFPDKEIPAVYTYISGFNQSIVTAENLVGISLDKYLGRDCKYYQQLNTTPQYKILNMRPERIIPEMAYAWGITEFENPDIATNLLGNMIQKGKIMYLVDAMLPTTSDSLKIGYTTEQLNWCEMNEVPMWTYLIEKKMLYSNKRMDIVRYINDAPTTSGFPLESPGRTGVWIGWQIVRQYMKKHPEVTLQQLMENNDFQKILNESEYDPG
ncbi:hypothetical protein [Maribellus sediminis]|uniref:gliding motility lipoprotein GldB n=1 Tax=Maribellus sediminis TaxID=2696285 RepID=UPI00142F66EB|nr:hypothetical protein [Maribellus sediminis]